MHRSLLLTVDGFVNLALGAFLIAFPLPLVSALGLPVAPAFYPSILGAVLLGIGIALLLEVNRRRPALSGLGLAGAIAINLCGRQEQEK